MVLTAIATLLRQTIGLDPDTVGSNRIARAAENRRVCCELPDLKSYWARLQTSASELEALVEQLIVPETWFFRDGKPFDYLKTDVVSAWLRSPNRQPLKLLSVPCSTGEEPYSLAIALLEAGLQPKQFAIDAIDISHQSLAKATRGIYTKNSFRGNAWTNRDRYFQPIADGYELSQTVRILVNFQQGNVMTALTLKQTQYDIIFCRNLLIYLQAEACSQVLDTLDRLLIPGGLLFVGASETGKIVANQYVSIREPFTFAYRKAERSLPPPLKLAPPRSGSAPASPQTPAKRSLTVKNLSDSNLQPSHPQPPNKAHSPARADDAELAASPDLQRVRELADDGRLAEAITSCQTYLGQHPLSADAYMLLGALHQADQQHEQAAQCFQRALYLEPNAYEALVHLALLKESQGDTVGATILHQRIQRLQHLRTDV